MSLPDLVLSKDEIKLFGRTGFTIPLHPKLLDPSLSFNPDIAHDVFERSAHEWYDELSFLTEKLPDTDDNKRWYKEVFLSEKPSIVRTPLGRMRLKKPYWEEDIGSLTNGFVSNLSISRNAGGSLFFNPSTSRDYVFISDGRLTCMPKDKALRFLIPGEEASERVVPVYHYEHHNIDNIPGALFLRCWALNYMNEVFSKYKEVFNAR